MKMFQFPNWIQVKAGCIELGSTLDTPVKAIWFNALGRLARAAKYFSWIVDTSITRGYRRGLGDV
jgi:hypothetical protein